VHHVGFCVLRKISCLYRGSNPDRPARNHNAHPPHHAQTKQSTFPFHGISCSCSHRRSFVLPSDSDVWGSSIAGIALTGEHRSTRRKPSKNCINIQSVPRSKRYVIKTSQLMLYREIIAVCSHIHTKHINTVRTAQ
jgi:hypothetical protein